MKKILGLAIGLALAGISFAETLPTAPAAEDPTGQVLVKINGMPLTGMELLIFNAQQGGHGIDSEQAQIALMNQAINTIVVAQAAEAEKLNEDLRVKVALNMARMQVLAEMQIQDYLNKHPIDDAQIKAVYDDLYKPENLQQYKVAHILVSDEQTAKNLIAELDKGAKFEELAKANSTDSSKDEGGELGWLEPEQVIPEFANSMVALKKGEYTKSPVASQFGWHIIMVSDIQAKQAPALEEVKEEISQKLQQKMMGEYIGSLRKAAKIEVPQQAAAPEAAAAEPVPAPAPASDAAPAK